jgi:hypothetical protein
MCALLAARFYGAGWDALHDVAGTSVRGEFTGRPKVRFPAGQLREPPGYTSEALAYASFLVRLYASRTFSTEMSSSSDSQ